MSTATRPNPDALLATVSAADARAGRGRLKIFFGAAAGVGKTYAMLEEARKRATEGVDVLIGYAEPHIRPDTEALLLGLDLLPYKMVAYKGATLKEFDLDAALARKPALICVDELAHTNAPGLRHPKRYQDILELLDAGISVYTTLNVQHLESAADIVEHISGITVRETLPDWVVEQADEVQLIDLPPEKLIERMAEGRIYKQHDVDRLTKGFFNKGNLSALRELALRRTAERVDAQMATFQKAQGATVSWPASDRLLVCVGPSPFAGRLVRAARRMAASIKAEWFAVYVETPAAATLSAEARDRVTAALRLAESLGGKAVTLTGTRPASELIAYARTHNVARIITGKPDRPRWRELFRHGLVDDLIRQSGRIEILVVREETSAPHSPARGRAAGAFSRARYLAAASVVAATSLLGALIYHASGAGVHFSNANVLMLDLVGVLLVALRLGRGPAVLASALAVLAFDFTVVPPYFSFAVSDAQYLLTFAVMFATAVVISTLTDRLQQRTEIARRRERRTAALLELTRDLASIQDKTPLLEGAVQHIAGVFECHAAVLLPMASGDLGTAVRAGNLFLEDDKELSVARWAFEHNQNAGATTDTLPAAAGLYVPLRGPAGVLGVLAVVGPTLTAFADPDRLHLLEAFANATAIALHRAQLADTARHAWERVEAEFIRNTLLSGVSHDLRTPLAAITGSVSTLLESGDALPAATRRELLQATADEAGHMDRLITNLLDITRLESGAVAIKPEPYAIDELVGAAVARLRTRLAGRPLHTAFPPDLPFISADGPLIEQVFLNLLENALQYTPPGSPIDIVARRTSDSHGERVEIIFGDRGPGLPADDPDRVFQKFYRSPASATHRGVGLGLAICRQLVNLHQGTISAANRADGGAAFTINLPAAKTPRLADPGPKGPA
ncbi:MAG TPA: sensor histidine kinase KdpD [Phycisphaerae bacterium]|nr:sensor histidine kinase KdpD [Phycisphaerae bacterium]